MRAPLDEGNCLSENCRAIGAVSAKFKRKVVLALKERDLLAGRRRVAGRPAAMEPSERKLQAAAAAQPLTIQVTPQITQAEHVQPRVPQIDAAIEAAPTPRGQYQGPSSARAWPKLPANNSARAKCYPNNTLVEDLSQCHENLLPKVTRATARTVELVRACLPASKRPAASKQQADATTSEEPDDKPPADQCDSASNARTKQAKFPMPASIVKLNSSLQEDDYNRALCMLTGDVRYQLHLLLYRRLQTIWTLFSTILCILIPIFCVGAPHALPIAGACLLWLGLQTTGAAVTLQFRKKLDQMLEKAVAQVNSYFMDHKLMLGVINVGGLLARARLVIPMLYFDTFQCREQIESILSADLRHSSSDGQADGARDKAAQLAANLNEWQRRKLALNYSKIGLHQIGPESGLSFAQSQLAKKIILRYSQRWISYFDRRKLMFTDDQVEPRHLSTGKCLCQFIEEHFRHDDLEREDELALVGADQVTVEMIGSEQAATCERTNNTNANNHWQPFEALVPTLSHLVSLKQRRDQLQLGLNSSQSVDFAARPAGYSSKLIASFATHLQQERQLAERDSSASPATELSVSLELADSADLLAASRNDELMRKLKLLLEAHKSAELAVCQTSGANCANSNCNNNNNNNNCINYAPRFATLGDLKPSSTGGSSQTLNQTHVMAASRAEALSTAASPMSQLGKKFFSQADGIFCLGAKRSQQQGGVYAKQQALEIC